MVGAAESNGEMRLKHGELCEIVRKRIKRGKTGAISMGLIKLTENWSWTKCNWWKIVGKFEKLVIRVLFLWELI